MTTFHWYKDGEALRHTNIRDGEVKLGQEMLEGLDPKAIFVVIGLPESIGVSLNRGIKGTESLWPEFLKSFCNVQSTAELSGEYISLGGILMTTEDSSINEIDGVVTEVIQAIADSGKVPIVIGGGHNNAYGIIKGMALSRKAGIQVINVDAHADLRRLEGRHSGNGFSYALEEGFLEKYAMFGLHKNYNSRYIREKIEADPRLMAIYYEDLFIENNISFDEAIAQTFQFLTPNKVGLEVDLDAIEHSLSSAASPCGLQSREVRSIIFRACRAIKPIYFHIAEGATRLENGQTNTLMGKLTAYLVTDFIRYHR